MAQSATRGRKKSAPLLSPDRSLAVLAFLATKIGFCGLKCGDTSQGSFTTCVSHGRLAGVGRRPKVEEERTRFSSTGVC